MSILQYASPTGEYSSYDRDIFEDYDNRIGTYNKALTEYKTLAEPYQGLVDTHNTAIGTYNTQLDKYKVDAAAYNKAIEEFNAGPRTTEYAGPASPGQFSGIMPIFQGGEAPVAPEDPGFSGADVDEFVEAAGDRARAVANSQATAQAVMTDPTQTYRTAAGDVNLGGMAGFSSTAMGMRDGGIVQNFQEGGLAMDSPYADPMQQNRPQVSNFPTGGMMAPLISREVSNPEVPQPMIAAQPAYTEVQNSLPPPQPSIEQFSSNNQGGIGEIFAGLQQARPQVQASLQGGGRGLGGIGGQFEQMNQMRSQMGNQFGQQMAGMQGAPLETYKSYLQQVYNQPEMEKATQALGGALDGRVDEFVNMVDEAERAHFGAEESFGFGGGEFQKGLMSQYENQGQAPMQRMQQGQMGQMSQMAMFENGGMVAARPPVSGPTPDVYMEEGGVPNPENFQPEITETNFEYTERPSYPEVRQMYVNILENLSNEEIQVEYGVSKKDLGETLAMLDVQYTYGSTDGPEGRGERFTEQPVSAPPVLESERPQMRPGSEVVSTTTGMMGMDPNGNLVEYGTEPPLNAEVLAQN
tara:strand:+ start:4055 stop:5794 length:1740 start_codon:yes stop_codon:yes gene_type:complete